MAEPGLSAQDKQDLAALRKSMSADDPRRAKIDNLIGAEPEQKGFFSSALDSSGLSSIPQLVTHPIDSITSSVRQMGQNVANAYSTVKAKGALSDEGRHATVRAIPIIGPVAENLANQVQAGNYSGAAGTVAGAVGGALLPEGGAAAFKALRRAAPSVAEGALSLSKIDRAYGKTPGRAALDFTTGVRPESVQASAEQALAQRNARVNAMADAHTQPVSIQPAVDTVQNRIAVAKGQNAVKDVAALAPVDEQLTVNHFNAPQPYGYQGVGPTSPLLATAQTARGALELKRGLRSQFVKNWNPDAGPVLVRDTARDASRVIDRQLDTALGPEFSRTNQEISSLIPVAEGAESTGRNAELLQKLIGRVRAHTGALTPMLAGAAGGAASHGTLGAMIGGAAGLALPELIGGPTSTMIMARALNSRIPAMLARPALAAPVLLPRRYNEDTQ